MELRDRAAIFSGAQLRPNWSRIEIDDELVLLLSAKAKGEGLADFWMGESADGFDLTTLIILIEELAWGDGSLALAIANKYLAHRAAQLSGDRDILSRVADRLSATAQGLEAVLLWPQTYGLDFRAAAPAQSLIKTGEGRLYVESRNSTARPQTSLLMGTALTDKGQGTHAFYLIDMKLDDVALIIEQRESLGLKASLFGDVTLEKRLGPHDLVVEFKDEAAYGSFWRTLSAERRLLYSAVQVGIARAAFEYALEYSKERVAFGKPISQHQAVGLKLADMATALDAARLMIWRAAETEAGGLDDERVESAWLYVKQSSIDVAVEAVQVLGGHGYLKFHPVEMWMRDIQFLRILLDDSDTF
jgi:alkylation response protein AidB-like acyl-CoA dehydrogenase